MARFHLGNGARLERLNWLGDTSPKGLREAHGLMVNYLYDLRFIEANHEAFANEGTIVASDDVRRHLPAPGDRGMNENLFEIFRQSFPSDLGRTFLERPDGSRLSYGDLVELSGRVARVLQELGVAPGDRVAAQVEKSAEALMLYLGSLRAGAVYLPLNTAYTAGEIRYFLGDAEPTLFVCRPELEGQMAELGRELGVPHVLTLGEHGDGSLWAQVQAATAGAVDVPRSRDDLAAFLYTSGTTGRSKGAMLSHGNLASNAATLRDAWRFTADDRLLHALPIFHTHGLFVATNITLMAGGSLLYLPRFDLARHDAPAAQGDDHDGRADLLHAPPVAAGLHPRAGGAHAPVRLGLGSALGRDPQGVQRPHRSRHSRALRHDRDQHEHLQPL